VERELGAPFAPGIKIRVLRVEYMKKGFIFFRIFYTQYSDGSNGYLAYMLVERAIIRPDNYALFSQAATSLAYAFTWKTGGPGFI